MSNEMKQNNLNYYICTIAECFLIVTLLLYILSAVSYCFSFIGQSNSKISEVVNEQRNANFFNLNSSLEQRSFITTHNVKHAMIQEFVYYALAIFGLIGISKKNLCLVF